jgi:hypothetical protein
MPNKPKKTKQLTDNALMIETNNTLKKFSQAVHQENTARHTIVALKQAAAQEGIRLTKAKMNEEQILALKSQREELMMRLINSPYIKGLQQKFITTIFPIGGSIIMMAYNLYNATPPIMTDTQRNELAAIGKRITDIPFKLLTGELKLEGAYNEFAGALKSLANFITNKDNLNIAINIGATLLESLHPIGSFIKAAVSDLLKSGMPKNAKELAINGLGAIATHFGKLTTALKQTAEKGLELAEDHKLKEAAKPAKSYKRRH